MFTDYSEGADDIAIVQCDECAESVFASADGGSVYGLPAGWRALDEGNEHLCPECASGRDMEPEP